MTTPLEPNKFPASWQVVQSVGEYVFHYREESRGIREHVKHRIIKYLIMYSKYSDGLELHAILEGPNKLPSSWKSDKKLSWSSATGKNYDSQVYLLCKITHDNVTCFLHLCMFISGYNYDVDSADMYRFSYIYFMHWSVQFTHSVVSNSLQPHRLHATHQTFCSIKTPGTCSNSCLQSLWCHPTISSSVPFSSCFQSFPGSGSFPMSQFFTSCGQSTGTSSSAPILPMNIQDWFPLGWTGWISLQSKGFSRVFSKTIAQKNQFFGTQLCLWSKSHIHTWLLEKQ